MFLKKKKGLRIFKLITFFFLMCLQRLLISYLYWMHQSFKYLNISIVSLKFSWFCVQFVSHSFASISFITAISFKHKNRMINYSYFTGIVNWMFVFFHPTLMCMWKPNAQYDDTLRWAPWEVISSWDQSLLGWNLCPYKTDLIQNPVPSTMGGYSEKTAVRKKQVLSNPKLNLPEPGSQIPSLQNCEKSIFIIYRPPNLW